MEQKVETTEVVSQSMPEVEVEAKVVYTPEELKSLTPTDIDLERVDPSYRPIVENTIRDYKNLQADHTRKAQELAELKRKPELETYFEDSKKDEVFKTYLESPLKVISDINREIAKDESVIPDDGADEYRAARLRIANWNAIKDEFTAKRMEVAESHKRTEMADSQLNAELGENTQDIKDYAQTIGLTVKDLRTKPELRTALKTMYAAAHPGKGKEVKTLPHKPTKPSGEAGGGGGGEHESDLDAELNLSVAERIRASEKRSGFI